MCAIDALGIGADVRGAIEIASRDPLTGEEIQVEVEPPTGAATGSRPRRQSSSAARAEAASPAAAAVRC